MRIGLYPRIAADGIRKNGRLYMPYIFTSILMIAVFYIMHLLGFSDMLRDFRGADTARQILGFGTFIMAFFGTIFLFYTQSTLIKSRLKEFGLYSVLGMNKKNLGRVIFFETLITWAISMAGGLLAGVGLSKLAELGFAKIVQSDVNYSFFISGESLLCTFIVYSIIFFLIFLNAVRQVRFARTINLVNAEKAGEKPPKANWVLGIIGFVTLISGYVISIRIESPISALYMFFIAVILIIIGTYLVLISGSVLLCRILQKNKKYYYKTNHFVSVSSMAFRMKRNGAGLASICILLTMILVMISSTSALYFNREETLENHYPRQLNCLVRTSGYQEENEEITAKLEEAVIAKAKEFGTDVKDSFSFKCCDIVGYYENNKLILDLDPMSISNIDYDKVVVAYFFDLEEYNRLAGTNEVLGENEVLAGVNGKLTFGDTLNIGDETFKVAKKIEPRDTALKYGGINEPVTKLIIITADIGDTASLYNDLLDSRGEKLLTWQWRFSFDTDLDETKQIELKDTINNDITGELEPYCESRANERSDFVTTFGGLFFLGILLSIIFLLSCVLIIYYKQISEGFEDQSRFAIMQKVGMTKENIKKSINSQMLTVFIIPIVFACLHLATVLPVIHKLLLLFGHNNIPLLLLSSGICVAACAVFYAVTYKLTSNAYYKIVS